jgi:hypothetical protein
LREFEWEHNNFYKWKELQNAKKNNG